MAELAKAKAKCTTLRRNVTNCLKRIETSFASSEVNCIELEESVEILKQREVELKELDEKIEILTEDLKEIEVESDTVNEYKDKIIIWKFRAEKHIQEQKRNLSSTSNAISGNKSYNADHITDGIKLPKLSLPTFSGNIIDWITFKDLFNAFKRFVARRGKPTEVWTDCGTNFVAANKELQRTIKVLKEDESTNQYFSNEGIKWNFNPPSAPHFGGLWEAAVKSAKSHLKRTIGEQILTQEEFSTLLAQVEACLNSRPLCPLPDDPSEFSVLTPGHSLIGSPLTALPEEDISDSKVPILHRWKFTQKLFQNFWKRWSNEYIANLQIRPKWLKVQSDLKIDDLVIIKEDNIPPLKWKLGRVIELLPSVDNKVRVVTVKTSTGICKRPIHKLSVLPMND